MFCEKLRANDKWMIPFVVSLSNHVRNRLVQHFPERDLRAIT